ncbi:MAG: aminopeptidase P family protein [Candidatus Omnitrophica bacterium]|nr:aminopeptidase P family protein [Candidatus Omnitrophota bacterium]
MLHQVEGEEPPGFLSMSTATLIIADSERCANLYYATRFLAPDPFIFLQVGGRKLLVMSDLEIDRARSQSTVDEVLSYTKLSATAKQRVRREPALTDVVDEVLRSHAVKTLEVPRDLGVVYADALRKIGYEVIPKPDPFYPERMIKSEEEIMLLTETLRATEAALAQAIELIHNSEIAADGTLRIGGKPLTAELIRKVLHLQMMERDCVGQHTIVAVGVQAVDPHNIGSGPLKAHEPIVMDVFPQHATSRYFADITRTVVKGKAGDKVRRMFDAVKAGQEIAFRLIKDGVDGSVIHNAILDSFEKLGFSTGEQGGRMQGFFHGTGHGVGLEIHEPPRISPRADTLKTGMVVTVEPGLYYTDAGGMRIEDMVVVTDDGCRVLTQSPKILEV